MELGEVVANAVRRETNRSMDPVIATFTPLGFAAFAIVVIALIILRFSRNR